MKVYNQLYRDKRKFSIVVRIFRAIISALLAVGIAASACGCSAIKGITGGAPLQNTLIQSEALAIALGKMCEGEE